MISTIDLSVALGTKGFAVNGGAANDESGYSVSSAGDVNGDGYNDIIIGAWAANPSLELHNAGKSYVIYGSSANPGTIDLANPLSNAGFEIDGGAAGDESGYSVSSAGDVNGDGYNDIIIGAPFAVPSSRTNAGKSYVIYGSSNNPGTIDLANPLGNAGFEIYGGAADDESGWSVSSAGDVNGDGYDDIIVGAPLATPGSRSAAGKSYVIYGSSANPGTIDLANPLGNAGFEIDGGAAGDWSGWSVSSAGDVNNDGYHDIIVGALFAAPSSRTDAGKSYVIYGSSNNPGTIDLANPLGSSGFEIDGGAAGDLSGWSVSSAGDVNNDGYSDIIIGAITASPNSRSAAGKSYVIYGSSTNPGTIDLANPLGNAGYEIDGGSAGDESGISVSSAGDVNNDGYNDIIIGAYAADPSLRLLAGKSYVIYGSSTNPGTIDLAKLLVTQGFEIDGGAAYDESGYSVSSTGDVNGDGYDDIIVGAPFAVPSSRSEAGKSYIIYGAPIKPFTSPTAMPVASPALADISLSKLTSAEGFIILGNTQSNCGWSVSTAGDINGDGYNDIMLGVPGIPGTSSEKQSYERVALVYGVPYANNINLASGQELTYVFTLYNDNFGWSTASAGDFNGDGYNDIIIGSPNANFNSKCEDNNYQDCTGLSYVVYGKIESGQLFELTTQEFGLAIAGAVGSQSGYSVSSAGDVNGDGYSDVIIGAPSTNSNDGAAYVIYGGIFPSNSQMALTNLTTAQGFAAFGPLGYSTYTGFSVAGAGDVNKDGFDDVIIGAPGQEGTNNPGSSYVIFGRNFIPNVIKLDSLTSSQGFSITGASSGSMSGISVSTAGDFNNDGYADVIIGAPYAELNSGFSYLVYGAKSLPASIDLSNLAIDQGFFVIGQVLDYSGYSVSSAGDVNGDGCNDVIIGAPNTNSQSGVSYVIFGCSVTTATINLVDLAIPQGFSISGANSNDKSGWSVSGAGDVNKDGFGDVIIGAPYANAFGGYAGGAAYVVYGGPMPTLAPTPSSKESIIDAPEFTSSISAGFSILSIISAWLLRNKIAIYILDNWGHKYILYNPYVQLKENEIAIKLSLNDQLIVIANFQEYPLLDIDSDSRGISKALHNTIQKNIEDPQKSSSFSLMQYEKNQVRDYLIAHNYIKPSQTFGCLQGYQELGYVKGTLYNFFLQNFETSHTQHSKKQARKEDAHNLSIDYGSAELGGAFSATNPIINENPKTENSKDMEHANELDGSVSKIQAMEISDRDTKAESGAKTNQRSCVVCSIDAMIEPQHVRLQNEEFARFGSHLTYAYQDLSKLITYQFSSSQSLLKDDVMSAEGANSIPEPSFPYADGLSSSLPRIQNALELYPLVKYISANIVYPLVETYIPESLQNITIPEISNAMLVTAHMSIGHLCAWQHPQDSVPFYIVESVAKSGSFAARLGVTRFINDYRDELEQNEQTITNTEAIKHCVSTILTYTVPDLLICAAAKTAMPGYECSDMNLGAKLSFAGSECYWSYKASQEPINPTAVDIVIPYIADAAAGVAAYANGYGLMGVVTSVIATDWMSRMLIDVISQELEEAHINTILSFEHSPLNNTSISMTDYFQNINGE